MIDQIRHLQSAQPFETFSIELTNGRIIQIYDQHRVSTAKGTHQGDAVIGVLYETGTFEVLNHSHPIGILVKAQKKWLAWLFNSVTRRR